LGITFDKRLDWKSQINKAVVKIRKLNQSLKLLRKYFTPEDMLQIIKSKITSILYYGSPIWLGVHTSNTLKERLKSNMARSIRIGCPDYSTYFTNSELHEITGILAPERRIQVENTILICKVHKAGKPTYINKMLKDNMIISKRREHKLLFISTNKKKVGLNIYSNRTKEVTNNLRFDPTILTKLELKRRLTREYGFN